MAVRLRLRREGTKKQPHYRVVAADRRAPRNGKFIEIIGEYHPMDDPSTVKIDHDRALHWLRNGAQPSSQVEKLLRIVGVWEEFKPGDEPRRERTKRAHEEAAAKLAKRGESQGKDAAEAAEAKQKAEESKKADEPEQAEESADDAEDTTKTAETDADETAETEADETAEAADDADDADDADADDADADADEDTEDES